MTKWAQVTSAGVIYDVVEIDPATIFHPDIAADFEVIPDNVDATYTKNSEGSFVAGAAPAEPDVVVTDVILNEGEFLAKLTRSERQGLASARTTNADLDDFLTMLEKTGFVNVSNSDVQTDMRAFVTASVISQATADAIIPS